jgi:hypothetical protein
MKPIIHILLIALTAPLLSLAQLPNNSVTVSGAHIATEEWVALQPELDPAVPVHNTNATAHSALFAAARTNATSINGVPVATVTAGAAAGALALQVESDTLQSVVTRGGEVTSGDVTIDAANAGTNTYGGKLSILGERVQIGGGSAFGVGSMAVGVSSVASGLGAVARGGLAQAEGPYSQADGYDVTAAGDYSYAGGNRAVAAHDNSYVWSDGQAYTSTVARQRSAYAANGHRLDGGAVTHNGTNLLTYVAPHNQPASTVTNLTAAIEAASIQDGDTLTLGLQGPDGAATNSYVTLHQLQDSASTYRTWQFWSGSNSTILAGAKAMRTIDEGNPPAPNLNTVTVNGNAQYITYCSKPIGVTSIKSGLYQVNATMYRSTIGADACSVSAEIYLRTALGVETELTAVSGTAAQTISGTSLEYIYSLNVISNYTTLATDSILLRFKTSAVGGAPVTLNIGQGFLSVPIPSTQFATKATTLSGYGITDAQPLDADLTRLAGNDGSSLVYPTNITTIAAGATGTNQVYLTAGYINHVRMLATNATLKVWMPATAGSVRSYSRVSIYNPNLKPVIWGSAGGSIYWPSNGTYTATARSVNKFGVVHIMSGTAAHEAILVATNATELFYP